MSNNKAAVLAAAERRRNSRCRTTAPGLLATGDRAKPVECTIRDLSGTGARVALHSNRVVPRCVHLINVRDRIVYEATIEWRTSIELGLKFLKSRSLAELTDPKLVHLKPLWYSSVMR